jgi:hypothetical protein
MKRKRSRSTFEIFEVDDTFAWRVVAIKKGESRTIATSDAHYRTVKKARRAITALRSAAVRLPTDPEPTPLRASRLEIDRSVVQLRTGDHRARRRDQTKPAAKAALIPAPPAAKPPAAKPPAAQPLGANAAKRRAAKKPAAKPPLGAQAAKRRAAKKAAAVPAKPPAAKPTP